MRAALEAIIEEHPGEANRDHSFKIRRRRIVGFEKKRVNLGRKREKRRVILFVSELGETKRLVSTIAGTKGYL